MIFCVYLHAISFLSKSRKTKMGITTTKLKSFFAAIKRHKYLCAVVGTIVYLLFLDEYNIVFVQLPHLGKANKLENEKQYYLNKISEDSIMLHELKTNDENLKKFAREHYYMKADDEEVFVVEER